MEEEMKAKMREHYVPESVNTQRGDFPEMPPLVRHAWFGAYSLNKKRPRGARSCILAHFQRVKLFL